MRPPSECIELVDYGFFFSSMLNVLPSLENFVYLDPNIIGFSPQDPPTHDDGPYAQRRAPLGRQRDAQDIGAAFDNWQPAGGCGGAFTDDRGCQGGGRGRRRQPAGCIGGGSLGSEDDRSHYGGISPSFFPPLLAEPLAATSMPPLGGGSKAPGEPGQSGQQNRRGGHEQRQWVDGHHHDCDGLDGGGGGGEAPHLGPRGLDVGGPAPGGPVGSGARPP
ncbi:hypothetical protein PG989_000602 [Apiospora arundinis]